jgi:hypothetical protein
MNNFFYFWPVFEAYLKTCHLPHSNIYYKALTAQKNFLLYFFNNFKSEQDDK